MNKRGQFLFETHCGLAEAALEVGGRVFAPDTDLAYLEARCAYSLPMVNSVGQAMLPAVIARSAGTWANKMVNLGHMVKSYDPKAILRDRIVGHVAGWEFTAPGAEGGWAIPGDRVEAPHCRLALAIYKSAESIPGLFGSAQTGRKKWTVSMETRWYLDQTAFAWKRDYVPVTNAVDIGGGWEGLAWDKAPADLRACWDDNAEGGMGAVTKKWGKRDVVLLLGGFDGAIEFKGIGLVLEGREPGAHLRRLLAGRPDGVLPEADGQGETQLGEALELLRLNEALKKVYPGK